jgi:hypothetical protein
MTTTSPLDTQANRMADDIFADMPAFDLQTLRQLFINQIKPLLARLHAQATQLTLAQHFASENERLKAELNDILEALEDATGLKRDQFSSHAGLWMLRCITEHYDQLKNDGGIVQSAFQRLNEKQKRICVDYVVCMLKPGQFLFDATPAQWSEGILRTIGKWQTEKEPTK